MITSNENDRSTLYILSTVPHFYVPKIDHAKLAWDQHGCALSVMEAMLGGVDGGCTCHEVNKKAEESRDCIFKGHFLG